MTHHKNDEGLGLRDPLRRGLGLEEKNKKGRQCEEFYEEDPNDSNKVICKFCFRSFSFINIRVHLTTRSKIYRCDSDLVAIDSNDSNNANDSNDQIITFNSPFNGKYLHRLFYGLFNGLQPLCDYFCSGRSNSRLVSHTSLFKFSDKSNLVINQLWSLIGFNHQSTLVMN